MHHDEPARNKAVIRHIFEDVLPRADPANAYEKLVDPEFVDHDAADAARARGVDSLYATHAYLHAQFPVVRFVIDEMIAENDLVAVRWSAGPAQAMVWFRLRDGKLLERRAMVRHQGGPRR